LYGHTHAADFDSIALETVRARMIQIGRCRSRVNKDASRIRRVFRWAAAKRLVPVAVCQLLDSVEGLRQGRSEARETPPVKPVPEAFVEATLPFLRPQTAVMVLLQLLTGMRPGEVVVMRGIDLDTSGSQGIGLAERYDVARSAATDPAHRLRRTHTVPDADDLATGPNLAEGHLLVADR
jgi:integrase